MSNLFQETCSNALFFHKFPPRIKATGCGAKPEKIDPILDGVFVQNKAR